MFRIAKKIRIITALTATLAFAGSGVASAAIVHRAGTTTQPAAVTSASTPMEAFPTGGKGSGTEETCSDWTGVLNEDEDNINKSDTTETIINAGDQLKSDINNAMDAGCAVID